MLDQRSEIITDEKNAPHVSEFRRFLRVFLSRRVVVGGLVVIILIVIIAIFCPLISPYEPNKTDVFNRLAQPSVQHWLGTDSVGRDTLSRLMFGARISLLVSILALIMAASIGISLGLIAGYFGGIVSTIIMRLMDSFMAIPMLLLALAVAAMLEGGIVAIIIALGVSMVPIYARVMCAEALSIKENDYVLAARSTGMSNLRIMLRHILPNCFPPLIVMITMQLGATILAEAGLSFLGIGIKPPTASWGNMVNDGYMYLLTSPVLALAPGVAIMLIVFAFNMVGDGLRDALDPRLRGAL